MRSRIRLQTLLSLLVTLLFAHGASAALLKYDIFDFSLAHFSTSSPPVSIAGPDPNDPFVPPNVALIDESGASPVLKKLLTSGDSDTTTLVPQLSGFIWFSINFKQGPAGPFTGTGATASSIAWGQTTGWTITGGTFCNASPSFICDLAVASQLTTVQPDLRSPDYDIGTWVFHGTGFTAAGFVFFTSTVPGNQQVFIKGASSPDGTVPALPVLGVGALGASLFAMGLAALRRRRQS